MKYTFSVFPSSLTYHLGLIGPHLGWAVFNLIPNSLEHNLNKLPCVYDLSLFLPRLLFIFDFSPFLFPFAFTLVSSHFSFSSLSPAILFFLSPHPSHLLYYILLISRNFSRPISLSSRNIPSSLSFFLLSRRYFGFKGTPNFLCH